MAIDTAKTITSGTATAAIKNRFYDELFLKRAEAMLVHKQLGQRNVQAPKGMGGYGTGSVYWTRWTNLPIISSGSGEGVPTTTVQLTASTVTGTTAQYDNAVSVSDLMAYTSFGDVMKQAIELLAYNAGLSIDTVVAKEVATSGTMQAATGLGSNWTAIPVTGVLSINEIKKAVRTLNRNNAFKQADGFYVATVHPDALYDLMTDSTTGGWIDANKYDSATSSKLLNGEVGRLHGVRFLDTTNTYAGVGSSFATGSAIVASSSIYVTSVFGREAFGVTELQNLQTFVKELGSAGAGDPTNKIATAGWKTTFGASELNNTFNVNIRHTVSSTA